MGKQFVNFAFAKALAAGTASMGVISLISPAAHADTYSAAASATVQAKQGTDASNTYLDVEGPTSLFVNSSGVSSANGSAFWSFGGIDFSASSFGITSTVLSVSSLTLSLTESNVKSTVGGGYGIYLMTDTSAALTTLHYDTTNEPTGITPSTSIIQLGTGTFTGTPTTNNVDTTTLSITDSSVISSIVSQLNSGGTIRLLIGTLNSAGYYSWLGTNASTSAAKPTLSLNATLDIPSYTWSGGSATWDASTTDWLNTSNTATAWDSSKRAVFATGSGTVDLGDDETAIGVKFDTTGYTIASSGNHTLTLSPNASGNIVSVTNASDTATISATIGGTVGLNKTGDGTLILSGSNTFSGDVTVSGGNLMVSSDAALGSSSNGVALNSGTFKSTSSQVISSGRTLSGSGNIDAASGTTLEFSGPVNAGGINLPNTGTVKLSNSSIILASASVSAGATLNITGSLVSSGGTSHTTFSGDGTVILGDNTGNSTGIQMNKGSGTYGPTVVMNSPNSLGSAQLYLNAGTLNAGTNLTGSNSIGTTVSFGGNATLSGSNMEFSSAWSFFSSSVKTLTVNNSVTFDLGIAAGASGVSDKLTKAGSGTLTLLAASSYVSGTAIIGGKIITQAGATLGTGDVSISSSGTANSILEVHDNAAIASTANVILSSLNGFYGLIDLEFTGSAMQVNTLQINGSYLAPGTYTAADEPGFLTGAGSIQVLAVPEPAAVGLLALAGGTLLLRRRKLVA